MYRLITKPAVLLSILALLPLASASAELKRVPLILMDTGKFEFPDPKIPRANLTGGGSATHLGRIVSTGVFESLGPGPPRDFKGKIEGTATAVPLAEMATATIATPSPSPSPAVTGTALSAATATPTPTPTPTPDTIKYRLSAKFLPDASGIFYGTGTYLITGGTGKFKGAKGFGEFIGLANFPGSTYFCFLRGVISY
jgi:hypothetical protein